MSSRMIPYSRNEWRQRPRNRPFFSAMHRSIDKVHRNSEELAIRVFRHTKEIFRAGKRMNQANLIVARIERARHEPRLLPHEGAGERPGRNTQEDGGGLRAGEPCGPFPILARRCRMDRAARHTARTAALSALIALPCIFAPSAFPPPSPCPRHGEQSV